jgi:hypothetical protein
MLVSGSLASRCFQLDESKLDLVSRQKTFENLPFLLCMLVTIAPPSMGDEGGSCKYLYASLSSVVVHKGSLSKLTLRSRSRTTQHKVNIG